MNGASTPDQEYGLLPLNSSSALGIVGIAPRDAQTVVWHRTDDSTVTAATPTDYPINGIVAMVTAQQPLRTMGDAGIYRSTFRADTTTIESTPLIDEAISWDGHPSVTPDGRWIIFSSDRAAEPGGADIWYCRLHNGRVSQPRPLVAANTPCDELSPWVTSQNTLLFSSPGHTSYGGYDIHEAQLLEEADSLRIGPVRNVGMPINSSADEIFPALTNDSTWYVASNRPTGRRAERQDFDVWSLTRTNTPATASPVNPPVAKIDIESATLVGRVINTTTNRPIVNAEVLARLPESTEILSRTETDSTGEYRLRIPTGKPVEITAQNRELFFDNFVTVVPASARDAIVNAEKPLGLSPTFVLRVNFPTSVFDVPYEGTLDSNGIEQDRSWKRDVQDLVTNVLSSNGNVRKLVLTGHTDDVDTDENNLLLGKKRVDFIIQRLIDGGLPATILEGRSQGERELLPRRPDESVESWRKRCRRVELVKVQ